MSYIIYLFIIFM